MENKRVIENLVNILRTKVYLYVFLTVTTLAVTIPVIIKVSFISKYKELVINNLIDESQKVSKFLSNEVNEKQLNFEQIDMLIKNKINVFDIFKVKYYGSKGELLYSTSNSDFLKESLTKHSHLPNKLLEGEVIYKINYKNTNNLENEKLKNNVVEIYVPFMKNGKFHSTFELYYIIDNELESFDDLTFKTMNTIYYSVFIAYSLFLVILFNASKNNINLKRKQKQLKNLAHRDSLTNLFNRRYFYDIAMKVLSLTNRDKDKLSVAMLDIDDFKLINDTYGHNVGDFVIKTLAAKLKKYIRTSDVVSRFGGEEFIILLPKTDIDGAIHLANKICTEISKLELEYNDLHLNFTVSIGVSEYKENQNIDDFINEADKALYLAKGTGKNKVEQL